MFDVKVIPVGILETNCYMIFNSESQKMYVIDPGGDAPKLIEEIKKYPYKSVTILLTHAHVDHIGAIPELAKEVEINKIYLHENDVKIYASANNHLMPYLPLVEGLPETSSELEEEGVEVITTPGHTPGGVCFYFKKVPAIFVGDTIFANSIGRTDLPGGDELTLLNSIRTKLLPLSEELTLYPGHGPATSIATEKSNNPFI